MSDSDHKWVRVLLVEDNPGDARLYREMLKDASSGSFELTHVDRLSAALESLAGGRIDVVLLDLSLPDSWGFDTFVRTHDQSPNVPIVILTGFDVETLAIEAMQRGAQDYLVKGQVDSNLLVRSIRYAIERNRVEEALRETERRYRYMVEAANDVVCTTDAQGYFTYLNPPGRTLTEYSEDELVGRHFTCIIAPDWRRRVGVFYVRQHAKRLHKTLLEFPIVTKSGRTKWVEQNVVLLADAETGTEFHAIVRDVTERKGAEEERDKLIRELREALANVKMLRGLLPICSSCKKIRDDKGYWSQIETYIGEHSEAEFTHGICPRCLKQAFPDHYLRMFPDGTDEHR